MRSANPRRAVAALALVTIVLATLVACGDDGEDATATAGTDATSSATTRVRTRTTGTSAAPTTATTSSPATPTLPPTPTTVPPATTAAPRPTAAPPTPAPPTPAPPTTEPIPAGHLVVEGTVCTRVLPSTTCSPGGELRWAGTNDRVGVTVAADGSFREVRPATETTSNPVISLQPTTPTHRCTITPSDPIRASPDRAGTVVRRTVECTTGQLGTIGGIACTHRHSASAPPTDCQPGAFFSLQPDAVVPPTLGAYWVVPWLPSNPVADDGTWSLQVHPGRYRVESATSLISCIPTPPTFDVAPGATVTVDVVCHYHGS